MQTNSLCDVRFNGLNSPLAGMIDNPNSQQLYFLDKQLRCTQQFVPAVNQSVTIKLLNLDKMSLEPSCLTQCGDNGCRCSSDKDMQLVDHLMIVNEEGLVLTCMCGSYDREAFPVSVRSWRALTLVYSVANYTWDNKGFGFSASYMFNADSSCGDRIYTLHDGLYICN